MLTLVWTWVCSRVGVVVAGLISLPRWPRLRIALWVPLRVIRVPAGAGVTLSRRSITLLRGAPRVVAIAVCGHRQPFFGELAGYAAPPDVWCIDISWRSHELGMLIRTAFPPLKLARTP